MTTTSLAPSSPATTPPRRGRRSRLLPVLPVLPFFLYVGLFLLLPTAIVVVGAFQRPSGSFTLSNLPILNTAPVRSATLWSVGLSAISAVTGAVLGGLLAYALSTADPRGVLRKAVVAVCSVLAQFGGVMLAFAFIAVIGRNGSITALVRGWFGVNMDTSWLYSFKGLVLVYAYFQIPLMTIVLLPALDGIRPQWREATETLGGSTWRYWRHVAGPILLPAVISSTLLLFANAFSAYATAAALISVENPLLATQIRGALSNEVSTPTQNVPQVLAFLMIIIVAVIMVSYGVLQRRASRYLT